MSADQGGRYAEDKSTPRHSIIAPQSSARKEARRLIEREVTIRHADERQGAGWWRRLVIWMKVQREVAAELKRRFPPQALYVRRFPS